MFAANVANIVNILELVKITKVPHSPEYMLGVINLRGEVLPLVDFRVKFGMAQTEHTVNTCILVLSIHLNGENIQVGALVDSVQEVLEIEPEELLPPPNLGNMFRSEFITNVYKTSKEDFIMVVDIDHIFELDEIEVLKQNVNEETQTTQ